jgi:hypothetical protein
MKKKKFYKMEKEFFLLLYEIHFHPETHALKMRGKIKIKKEYTT